MQTPAKRPEVSGASERARETRRLVASILCVALAVAAGLVVIAIDRTDEVFAPGSGSLGSDPMRIGPRAWWSQVPVPARAAVATQSAEQGPKLYAQWCASCHGDKGAGDGILAKALLPPPRDFTKGRFRFRTTPEGSLPCDADLMRTLTVGVLPSRMPSFGFLPPADRWALVDEVKHLSAFYDDDEKKSLNHFELNPPDPPVSFDGVSVATDAAAIERGKVVFLEKGECWKCHGKEGLGDGPSAPTLVAEEGSKLPAANLRRGPAGLKSVADAKDVFRVLNLGISGTPMPSYAKSLTADELGDLAAYTASLWAIDPEEARTISRHGSVMPTARESQRTLGETTFLANCAGCHGKLGRGDGVAAAGFMVRPANLAAGITKFKTTPEGKDPTPEDWKRTLRRGIPGSSMPAWGLHSEAEVDAVVSYLSALGGSRSPKGAPVAIAMPPRERLESQESAARGRELFGKSCVACHGGEGAGDGVFANILTDYRGEKLKPRNLREEPMKYGERPEDLMRVISEGFEGTPMPGFGRALTDDERFDLVAFILSIRPGAPAANLR
jgi:cytochrome c oxidase cbb3-type subunit 2